MISLLQPVVRYVFYTSSFFSKYFCSLLNGVLPYLLILHTFAVLVHKNFGPSIYLLFLYPPVEISLYITGRKRDLIVYLLGCRSDDLNRWLLKMKSTVDFNMDHSSNHRRVSKASGCCSDLKFPPPFRYYSDFYFNLTILFFGIPVPLLSLLSTSLSTASSLKGLEKEWTHHG